MSKKKRFPFLFMFVVLSCCLCPITVVLLAAKFNPMGLMMQLAEGGSSTIDSYPQAPPRQSDATMLFSDDFSTNKGWNVGAWGNGQADFVNGGYQVAVTDLNLFTYLGQQFPADVSIEVDVSVENNPLGHPGFFGVLCRNQNEDGFEFTFAGDFEATTPQLAWVGISRQVPGGTVNFLPEEYIYSDTFIWPQNWRTNFHLRADCTGNQLSLYINGYLVQSVTSSIDSTSGKIGLFAGHVRGTDMLYTFNNLVVYAP